MWKKLIGNAPRLIKHEKLLFFQLCKWYISHPWNQIGETINIWEKTGILVLLLKGFGINIGWHLYTILCLILMFVFLVIGRMMVMAGMIDNLSRISNARNPDQQEIKKMLIKLVGYEKK